MIGLKQNVKIKNMGSGNKNGTKMEQMKQRWNKNGTKKLFLLKEQLEHMDYKNFRGKEGFVEPGLSNRLFTLPASIIFQ